ncbi:MAG TPA: YceI family protein, partial [Bacteroidia bacterium]|nr:YceI family protein [Bacteroidia bacterium]
ALDVASVNTQFTKRDDHLKSAEIFDVAEYPLITFKSTSIRENTNGAFRYTATGDLTIKNITKTMEVPFNYNGAVDNPYGFKVYTFSGSLEFKRDQFNIAPDLGSPLVANEVYINFSIETNSNQ